MSPEIDKQKRKVHHRASVGARIVSSSSQANMLYDRRNIRKRHRWLSFNNCFVRLQNEYYSAVHDYIHFTYRPSVRLPSSFVFSLLAHSIVTISTLSESVFILCFLVLVRVFPTISLHLSFVILYVGFRQLPSSTFPLLHHNPSARPNYISLASLIVSHNYVSRTCPCSYVVINIILNPLYSLPASQIHASHMSHLCPF